MEKQPNMSSVVVELYQSFYNPTKNSYEPFFCVGNLPKKFHNFKVKNCPQ